MREEQGGRSAGQAVRAVQSASSNNPAPTLDGIQLEEIR